MKRFFTVVLAALAMITVALVSAFIAMRLAIHGREVKVPTLTGLSVQDAAATARRAGLSLTLENRFYAADVPAGQVLAQSPAPGSNVRREWAVRITESLGGQRVAIPDLTGESERAATVSIRRLSLDPGTVSHLVVPGDPGIVLAQSPPANSAAVTGPRVSLLVSDSPAGGAGTDAENAAPEAYVMPSLVGLPWPVASARASAAGLRLVPVATPDATPAATSAPATADAAVPPAAPAVEAADAAPVRPSGTITAQTPPPGRRVVRGDVIHVALGHPPAAAPTDASHDPSQ